MAEALSDPEDVRTAGFLGDKTTGTEGKSVSRHSNLPGASELLVRAIFNPGDRKKRFALARIRTLDSVLEHRSTGPLLKLRIKIL